MIVDIYLVLQDSVYSRIKYILTMRVVVLGGAGQIGAPLVKLLNNLGHMASSIDILDYAEFDLRLKSRKWIDELEKADFVFFLAFDVGGSKYLENKQRDKTFIDNNVQIMFNTFNAIEELSKPLVFVSSQMSGMNYSVYGILKRLGEFYTQTMNGVVCKFWNVYGIEHSIETNHVVSDFVNMALKSNEIKMRTSGKERRQFLFVEDACNALVALMDNYSDLDKNVSYDVSSHEWITVLELANIISSLTGASIIPGIEEDATHFDSKLEQSRSSSIIFQPKIEPNHEISPIWRPKYKLLEGLQIIVKTMKQSKPK